ncbi:Hsp20/alpha crystallin family protein [Streptacidiphilus sp. EB103A]|uniref:Hsp20/alpha crystallin family protein n=1 Tax=Streptacidiphilus sp. EB103A TaxID=3156275 RepID=UPI003515511B
MFMRTTVTSQVNPTVRQDRPESGSQPVPIPADAWRDGDRYVVALDLPGVPAEAIDVEVAGRQVTVRAERRPTKRTQAARTEAGERRHGAFARRIELPDTLDAGRLKARLHDGVLTLTVPVAGAAKPRKITIQGAEGTRPRPRQDAAAPAAA